MAARKKTDPSGLSEDAKTIIVVLLLVFAFPVGLILMWIWTAWPKWTKWLLTSILIIPLILIILFGYLVVRVANDYDYSQLETNYNYEEQIQVDYEDQVSLLR